MPTFAPPLGYSRIKLVGSFDALVTTRFADGVNAICWPRTLEGDFDEIVSALAVTEDEDIISIDEERLRDLVLSDAGKLARDILIQDQQMLQSVGLDPVLDWVRGSRRHLDDGPLRTDVQSFHADSATIEADTYLCSYNVAATEGLRNEEAIRRVDIPETRAELLKVYGGEDDERFIEYLNDNYYDLHYAPLPQAQPYSFGFGHLWRIAIAYPDSPVPPCIHRAPTTLPGQPPRLLLLS